MRVERELIDQIEQLGTMVDVQHGMLSQHAESVRGQTCPALGVIELDQCGRMAFEHGKTSQERHRMGVANPVVLRADQRGDGRCAVRPARRGPVHSERGQILQQPLLVLGFLGGVLFQILDQRPVQLDVCRSASKFVGRGHHERNRRANRPMDRDQEQWKEIGELLVFPEPRGHGLEERSGESDFSLEQLTVTGGHGPSLLVHFYRGTQIRRSPVTRLPNFTISLLEPKRRVATPM